MSHDAHGEKNDSILKVALNMMMACLLSGAIIAGVYASTAAAAVETMEKAKTEARQKLVEDATEFKPIKVKVDIETKDGVVTQEVEWYEAMKDGQQIAYILPAEWKGYEGIIRMLASVDMEGKLIKYQILSHRETPGLGDGALKPDFIAQFKGRSVDELEVVKLQTPENKDKTIQAMTGATITTRAVVEGVKRAANQVIKYEQEKTQKK